MIGHDIASRFRMTRVALYNSDVFYIESGFILWFRPITDQDWVAQYAEVMAEGEERVENALGSGLSGQILRNPIGVIKS